MDFIFNPKTILAMYFELVICIITGIMVILILQRYLKKRNEITLLLFFIFLFLLFAVITSYLSKLFWLEYYNNPDLLATDTLLWLKARIIDYRISYSFSVVSGYLTFVFQSKIFDNAPSKAKIPFLISAIVIVTLALFVYGDSIVYWNTIIAVLNMIYVVVIYSIFMIKSIKLFTRLKYQENVEMRPIKSLILMSVFFLMIYISAALNQIMYLYTVDAYNPPYFLIWSSAVAAMVSAYFGYLNVSKKK